MTSSAVSSFRLPGHVSYHPGHTWAMWESHRLVRTGLDDFAACLPGASDRIEPLARGRWLRQLERAWTVARRKHRFEILSTIEGAVVDLNQEVAADASLALGDPCGEGFLVAVNAPGGLRGT